MDSFLIASPVGISLSDVDGLTFAVKDNLCTKDILTTCSSEFLRGKLASCKC